MFVTDAASLRAAWVTSSFSGGGNNCVQAAVLGTGQVAVRDAKDPSGPALIVERPAWRAFISGVRTGEFHP